MRWGVWGGYGGRLSGESGHLSVGKGEAGRKGRGAALPGRRVGMSIGEAGSG